MHWILQTNFTNEPKWQEMIDTLIRFNIPYSVHKVIPFVGELHPKPDVGNNAICFGSYSMRHTAKTEKWYPGVFDLEPFDFTQQLAHWGDEMLNAESIVGPLGQAMFPEDAELMFLRPILDSKSFSGQVMDAKEFTSWQHKIAVLKEDDGSTITGDTVIQMCHPIKIVDEYRYWIVKGKIVTRSLYKRGNKVIYSDVVDSHIDDYVNYCINIWQPLPAFVIDVCRVGNVETGITCKIVEINTLNAAGFYAADMQKLVFALENEFAV